MTTEQDFPIERVETVRNWRPFMGEGEDYIERVLEKFKAEFNHLPGIHNIGYGNNHGSTWVIDYSHPFIFDQRKAPPAVYLGVDVKGGSPGSEMPEEFQTGDVKQEYVWAYQRYEKFVDRCGDQIGQELGNPNMSREEMLDALTPGGNFQSWRSQCQIWEEQGTIPRYQEKLGEP